MDSAQWAISEAGGKEEVSFLKKLPNAPSEAVQASPSECMDAIDRVCERAYQRFDALRRRQTQSVA